jgi:hypothetical protein
MNVHSRFFFDLAVYPINSWIRPSSECENKENRVILIDSEFSDGRISLTLKDDWMVDIHWNETMTDLKWTTIWLNGFLWSISLDFHCESLINFHSNSWPFSMESVTVTVCQILQHISFILILRLTSGTVFSDPSKSESSPQYLKWVWLSMFSVTLKEVEVRKVPKLSPNAVNLKTILESLLLHLQYRRESSFEWLEGGISVSDIFDRIKEIICGRNRFASWWSEWTMEWRNGSEERYWKRKSKNGHSKG